MSLLPLIFLSILAAATQPLPAFKNLIQKIRIRIEQEGLLLDAPSKPLL